MADQEVWDKSLRTLAALKLTTLANEWLADNDQTDRNPKKDPITEEEFARRILLTEFTKYLRAAVLPPGMRMMYVLGPCDHRGRDIEKGRRRVLCGGMQG